MIGGGIVVAVVGAVVAIVTPAAVAGLVNSGTGPMNAVAEVALQIGAYVLSPLGGSLIAAGIVMRFLEQLLERRSGVGSPEDPAPADPSRAR